MDVVTERKAKILNLIITAVLSLILSSYIVKWCWNYTLPELFGIKKITNNQSIVLLILINILFSRSQINYL